MRIFSLKLEKSNEKSLEEQFKISNIETPTFIKKFQPNFEANQRFETPVKIQDYHNEEGFETPIFIHKKESKTEQSQIPNNPEEQLKSDIENFSTQLTNVSDQNEKVELCKIHIIV
jgi:hypothetical protein